MSERVMKIQVKAATIPMGSEINHQMNIDTTDFHPDIVGQDMAVATRYGTELLQLKCR